MVLFVFVFFCCVVLFCFLLVCGCFCWFFGVVLVCVGFFVGCGGFADVVLFFLGGAVGRDLEGFNGLVIEV